MRRSNSVSVDPRGCFCLYQALDSQQTATQNNDLLSTHKPVVIIKCDLFPPKPALVFIHKQERYTKEAKLTVGMPTSWDCLYICSY